MNFLQNHDLNNFLQPIEIQREILRFSLHLHSLSYLPNSGVDNIIHSVDNFISQMFLPYLSQCMNLQLKDLVSKNVLNQIYFILNQNKNHFKNFSTTHLRYKQYKQNSVYIDPIEYQIGEETAVQLNEFEEYSNISKPVTIVHIPIPHTLKVVLEIPNVYYEMKKYKNELLAENDFIQNIVQGKLWQRKYECKNRESYPLLLFFDDFKTGNALGSHAGKQKLGGVYLSIPCLPPHITMYLKNCFLTSTFYSANRLTYGNYVTFKSDIDELNLLSESGLKIMVNGVEHTIYFDFVFLLGDNLGLNSCCGFVESFNANFYCRICRAKSDQCQIMSKECVSLLRTPKNYAQDLESLSCGIKEECVFNRVKDFHIAENRSMDIMHDIFEGIAVYTLENILNTLILRDKIVQLNDINNRIQTFPYSRLELRNKPTEIKIKDNIQNKITGDNKKVIIKQSASEMLCLCRYLPIMIGDLIPRDNKHWKLFRILRKIIGIITRPNYATPHLYSMSDLEEQFNALFIELYETLPPKGHFGTHIPLIMLENGPPIHFWSMMYEAMNKDMKNITKNVQSHKNLPLTIAKNSFKS